MDLAIRGVFICYWQCRNTRALFETAVIEFERRIIHWGMLVKAPGF